MEIPVKHPSFSNNWSNGRAISGAILLGANVNKSIPVVDGP